MEVHYESLTVVETDVHYPTDVNLLWDALRCLLRVLGAACPELGVGGWRQSAHLTEQVRSAPQRRGRKGNGIRLVEGACAIDLLDWRTGRPVISSCWASSGRRVCA